MRQWYEANNPYEIAKTGKLVHVEVKGLPLSSDSYRQELENLRHMKAQAHLTALSAPLGVKKASQSSTVPVSSIGSSSAADKPSISMPDASGLRENGYDPATSSTSL